VNQKKERERETFITELGERNVFLFVGETFITELFIQKASNFFDGAVIY
jgi:hypothetical protein